MKRQSLLHRSGQLFFSFFSSVFFFLFFRLFGSVYVYGGGCKKQKLFATMRVVELNS